MNWNEGLRPGKLDHSPLLVPMGVAARVDPRLGNARHQVRSSSQELGHHLEDRSVIARNDSAREHDKVAGINPQT
jgi:hypothetical protein